MRAAIGPTQQEDAVEHIAVIACIAVYIMIGLSVRSIVPRAAYTDTLNPGILFVIPAVETAFWPVSLASWVLSMMRATQAERELRESLPELSKLRDELLRLDMSNPLRGIVEFFGLTSPWHDSNAVAKLRECFEPARIGNRHRKVYDCLQNLQAHIWEAGRDMFGPNRTQPGEPVTKDKVFLGNVWQIWTFPVSKWLEHRDDGKPNLSHPRGLTDLQCIKEQARNIMASHIGPMVWLINELEELDATASS